MTNFDTKREASDFAESVASAEIGSVSERNMSRDSLARVRVDVRKLLASAEELPFKAVAVEEGEGDDEVDPQLLRHQMAPLASPIKQALRRILAISAEIEDYGTLPTASPLKIRDEDPLFDMYLLINAGREGTLFMPGASHVAALRSIDVGLRSRIQRMTNLEFVGVYVKPAGPGKIELGVRVMWGGN